MAQGNKRKAQAELPSPDAPTRRQTRQKRSTALPTRRQLPSSDDAHAETDIEDVGREDSEMMLMSIKPAARGKNKEDPWVSQSIEQINSDETELLRLLAEKQREATKQAESYKTHLRSVFASLFPATAEQKDANNPKSTSTRGKDQEQDENDDPLSAHLDPTFHPLHKHATQLLSSSAILLQTYKTAASAIDTLDLPADPSERFAEDKAKLGKVLEAGKWLAEKEIEELMDGKKADQKEMDEGCGVKKEDVVLFRRLVDGDDEEDGDGGKKMKRREVEGTGVGIADVLKDVSKGVGRMVKRLPKDVVEV